MSNAERLYDQDFFRWTQQQAQALRAAAGAGSNLPVDWENVAEEVESLGKSLRHNIRSRLSTIIEHLLKLDHSPAADPGAGWTATVLRERLEVHDLLDENPSLRREVSAMVTSTMPRTAKLVAQTLELFGQLDAAGREALMRTVYDQAQVLGDWLPPRRGG